MTQNEFTQQLAMRLLLSPNWPRPFEERAEKLMGTRCPRPERARVEWWREAEGRAAYQDAAASARGVYREQEKFE